MLIEFGDWLTDILEENAEEAAFLWMQRQAALTSPAKWPFTVRRLESRVAAHIDALVLAGPAARPLLEPMLRGDTGEALAAAHALLLTGSDADARLVLAALREAEGPALEGLRLALCLTPIDAHAEQVKELLRTADAPAATAAAEALAWHASALVDGRDLDPFLRDGDPLVRTAAWRVAAALPQPLEPSAYAAALRDHVAEVRTAALHAAAWNGVPGALHVARQAAAAATTAPRPVLELLAVIGMPADATLIARLGADPALGPARFELLAACGALDAVEPLISAMSDEDAVTAAAAGTAFQRLTGIDVDSGSTAPASQPADDVEAEFVDEVMVPDAALAREGWDRLLPSVSAAGRLCCGMDVDRPLSPEMLELLDMRSRAELALRRRFRGLTRASVAAVQRYPLDQTDLLA